MVDTDETWKPVVGFEGFYEVSSLGRVRSLDRVEKIRNRWGDMARVKRGKILTPGIRRTYLTVDLRAPGRPMRHYLVHRLVLEAFVGPAPEGKPLALHWNDVPTDNRLENLRWGDEADNAVDAVRNGGHWNASKDRCPRGHEYARRPDNGHRRCRSCERAAMRKVR